MGKVISHRCNQCNYVWESRMPHPKVCAKCKSHKWGELAPELPFVILGTSYWVFRPGVRFKVKILDIKAKWGGMYLVTPVDGQGTGEFWVSAKHIEFKDGGQQ